MSFEIDFQADATTQAEWVRSGRISPAELLEATIDRVGKVDPIVNALDPAVDFTIRYGAGRWPNTASEVLFEPEAFPVCSPSFLARHGPMDQPADLAKAPLIHNVSRQWWVDWFAAAGVASPRLLGGIVVDEYGLAVQFALDGHGAALGRGTLLDGDLRSGALVRLFDISVVPRFSYHLVRDIARAPHPDAELLMRWLRRHVADRDEQLREEL